MKLFIQVMNHFFLEIGSRHTSAVLPGGSADTMHGKKIILVVAMICACFSIVCSPPKRNTLPAVKKVNHRDIIEMIQKDHHKATLVNIWATWCEPCRDEMPGLIRLRQKYGDNDLNVIIVSADDIEKADTLVPRTLNMLGVDFPTYIDNDSTDETFISGMNPHWSGALPASFLYDREGNLVDMLVGGKSYEKFEKAVLKILR